MEEGSVWIVLVLLVGVATYIGRRIWGKSFDDMIADQEREYHDIHAVLARHPKGGTWPEFRRWMEEEN